MIIRVEGDRLCAIHHVHVHAGGHDDEGGDLEPSITGKVNGKLARVKFESSFGGTGTAALRVDGNALQWKILTEDGGENWIPEEAQLHRIPERPSDQMPVCGN